MKKAKNTPHEWSEDKLQSKFFLWFHNTFPAYRGLLIAIPNGGKRSGLQGKILKATGVWPGVSDMMFFWDGITYMLELKRPDGKGSQSPAQKAWEELIKSQCFKYVLYNDLDELKEFILTIMVDWSEGKRVDNQLEMF